MNNPERPMPEMPALADIPKRLVDTLVVEVQGTADWKRINDAMAVLKGEKEAIAPKAPEPEPTDSQKFWRDMYRSGKLTPYQKDRPGIRWETVKSAWNDPNTQGETSKIMAVDMAIRGGADKEYNQLGDMSHRKKRMGAMVENMLPNIAFDIVTSLPYNFGEKAMDEILKVRLKEANALSDEDTEKKPRIKSIETQIKVVRSANKLIEVFNDKDVTARGDKIMQDRTGEKGWFTGESSDKLNDFLTAGFGEYIEDFVNGPTIESTFRILYQIPVAGALIEQGWTRWTNFQSKNAFNKGRMKAVYASAGMLVGLLRNVNERKRWTPSALITDGVWSVGTKIYRKFNPAPESQA